MAGELPPDLGGKLPTPRRRARCAENSAEETWTHQTLEETTDEKHRQLFESHDPQRPRNRDDARLRRAAPVGLRRLDQARSAQALARSLRRLDMGSVPDRSEGGR